MHYRAINKPVKRIPELIIVLTMAVVIGWYLYYYRQRIQQLDEQIHQQPISSKP
jgi:hypothetical protein